jgi:precorrin-6B methylase 2
MSPEELIWLMVQARNMESVVEIGSLHGRSAFALLTACPGRVYCIDPWDDSGWHSYGSFMGNVGHFDNLIAIQDYSPAAASQVPDVDMVFIDGDHGYESVVNDLVAWYPKTRKLICGHDYYHGPEAGFPGVAEAVDHFFGGLNVMCDEGTSIWYVEV